MNAADQRSETESIVLAIGAAGLEESSVAVRAVGGLINSIGQRDSISIVLVGLPRSLVQRFVDEGIVDEEKLPQNSTQSVLLTPGTTWLIPNDVVLTVAETRLQAEAATIEDRFPVDDLFKLLAQETDFHIIGLLLHGKNSDGILGLRSISDCGGLALLEAPLNVEGVEQELVNRRKMMVGGDADYTAELSQLSTVINRYIGHHLSEIEADVAGEARRSIIESLGEISDILHQETNHQFKNYKTSTLVRRVERRLKVNRLTSIESYLEKLRANEAERTALFRDLLISVTSFFRDPEYLEKLKSTVLRRQIETQGQLRIWVAGCASGEEAFSLAIICDELRRELSRQCEIQIFATDIDTRALAVARSGDYPQGIETKLSKERRETYFVKKAGRYQVVKAIREMCLFSVHNFISDPPFSKLDLIVCRNVLIYLGSHLQIKLIPLFHFALNPSGYLFLGPSESLSGNRELFKEIDHKHRIWQRRQTAVDGKVKSATTTRIRQSAPMQTESPSQNDLKMVAQRIMLGEFSPEWVIFDEDCKVVSSSDEIESFLRIGGGAFQNNVVSLAKTGLKAGLRATINESIKKRRRIDHDRLSMRVKGGIQRVRLTVQPMPRLGNEGALLMAVFRKEGAVISRDEYDSMSSLNAGDALIQQLESDLARTREDLEKSFRELEKANEELKSSNEELLSMNEELQTANEELESSKEELNTANSQLLATKNDLENLFQSSDIAMIFVDREMNVKGFTDAAKNIYNLIESDVGRPLWHLTHSALEMPELPSLEELSATNTHDVVVKTYAARVYKRRVLPYLDRSDGSLLGMVLSFTDETRSIKSEYRARFAMKAGRMGVWTWNFSKQLIELDEFAQQLLGVSLNQSTTVQTTWSVNQTFINLNPHDREELQRESTAAYAASAEFSTDCRMGKSDQDVRWVTISGGIDPLENGAMTGIIFDITQRKESFNRLTESESFNRAIFENSPDCVKVIRRDGNVESMNANGCKLMEVDDFELIRGRSWWELWPEKQGAMIKSAVDAGVRGELVHFQAECPTAKGKPRWWDVVVASVSNESGRVDRLIAVSRDITEQKHREQLTVEFAEKLRAAMEVAEVGIVTVDYRFDQVICDPVAARIMGVPAEIPLSRQRFHERFEASDRQRIMLAADLSLKSDGDRGFFAEARIQGGFGFTWVNLRKRNYFDDAGNPVRGLMAIQNISDLRRTESDLRDQHRRLEQILTAARAGTWDWDVPAGTINWSQENYRLFGLEDQGEQLTMEEFLSQIVLEDRQRVEQSLREAFEYGKREWRSEYQIEVGEKTRWLYSSGTIDYHSDGKPLRMAGINLDISPQKALEQELIAARDLADVANRARGEFLANMSHEIRTPMTAILGHAEILAGQLQEADDLQSLDAIRRNGRHLLELINDILDLSRIDAGKLEIVKVNVSPAVLLADIRSLMDVRAAEKRLSLEFRIDTKIPESIRTDEMRLRQILINLLGNAIKFTSSGSVMVVVRFDESQRVLYFSIQDTGIGISTDVLPSLFDAFTQADSSQARRFEGTGLGLAISRRLAHALGGEIQAESKPGVGSTFTLLIPCEDANGQRIQPDLQRRLESQSTTSEIPRIDAVVLIVDDRRDIRLIAQHMVEKAGGRVLTAENGQQAVDLLMSEKAKDVDLVLMDMQMPVLDGYAAVKELRRRGFAKPIIALTANAMKEDRERCIEAGCDDYTSKPLDNRKLIESIAQLLTRLL